MKRFVLIIAGPERAPDWYSDRWRDYGKNRERENVIKRQTNGNVTREREIDR